MNRTCYTVFLWSSLSPNDAFCYLYIPENIKNNVLFHNNIDENMNYSIFTRLKHLLVSFHAQCRAQKFFFYFKKVSVCLFLFFYCYLFKYFCVTIISLRDLNFSYFPLTGKHSQFLFLLRTGYSLPLLDQKEWFQTVSYIPYQYHFSSISSDHLESYSFAELSREISGW